MVRESPGRSRSAAGRRSHAAAAVLALAAAGGAGAQVRQVIDMRQPLPGLTRVTPEDWHELPPIFLGDVNSDGFADYGLWRYTPDKDDTVIVYGAAAQPAAAALDDLRPRTVLK